ncbi:MAG: serine/threonine protein kinase [Gemmatimonadetes bacterium]|nr:serine/threonine protein kinase [Gemmatimonadota bacterium]
MSPPNASDRDRWTRIEAICADALEVPAASRSAFLDRACAGDLDLRREVDSLLAAAAADPDYLARPLLAPADLPAAAAGDDPPPAAIGPYRIVRRLGRGGMGDVYLAIQKADDLERPVAIKVIRGATTAEVLARFRLERRLLASLDHPNIARLLDAGATADNQPFLVMEYLEGVPLDQYLATNTPPLAARLDLFRAIAAAVHHAHQNLIVHRDLKPRNILVTPDGVPKLLDFGIAKLLTADQTGARVETQTGYRLLTPEYAAPEQLAGGPITTATDGYALGVLLFTMLTGRHPQAALGDSLRDIERKILDTDPRPPSELAGAEWRRQLAGDLDTIVLKALAKEPHHRYPSVLAFAEDVERFQQRLPIVARPATLRYRVRKFVARNTAAVAAGAVAVAALLLTTAVTLVQSARVRAEAARVARERDKALEIRGFLMEMFGATGADQATGDTVSVRQLLDIQAALVDSSYADRPDVKAELMEVLADGYDRLGLYRKAAALATQALALRRAEHRTDHPDLAGALNLAGWIHHELGQADSAEPLLREAVAMRERLGPRHRTDLARSQNDLGVLFNATKRYPEAESVLTRSLAIRRELLGDNHRAVGITANNLAAAQYFQRNVAGATEHQTLAVRSLERAVGPDHQRTIVALGNLAAFKSVGGDLAGAEREYRDLLARQARLQGDRHPVTLRTIGILAATLTSRGQRDNDPASYREADSLYRTLIPAAEAVLGPAHPDVLRWRYRQKVLDSVMAATR